MYGTSYNDDMFIYSHTKMRQSVSSKYDNDVLTCGYRVKISISLSATLTKTHTTADFYKQYLLCSKQYWILIDIWMITLIKRYKLLISSNVKRKTKRRVNILQILLSMNLCFCYVTIFPKQFTYSAMYFVSYFKVIINTID